MFPLQTTIVGMNFRPAECRARYAMLVPGEMLMLEREPTNAFDPNAIKVLAAPEPEAVDYAAELGDPPPEPRFIAYIPKVHAVNVAPVMDAGQRVRCMVIHLPNVVELSIEEDRVEPKAEPEVLQATAPNEN